VEEEVLQKEIEAETCLQKAQNAALSACSSALVEFLKAKEVRLDEWKLNLRQKNDLWNAEALHEICQKVVQLWKIEGVPPPSLSLDEAGWTKFFATNRTRTSSLKNHVLRCNIASESEPRSKIPRISLSKLSVLEMESSIKSTFGIWLYKKDTVAFSSPSYRARHVSAAVKWIVFIMRNDSVHSRLHVSICEVFVSFD
jgi:hypothetical protein